MRRALALLLLGALACGGGERHPARGVVRDVQPELGQVVIAHEAIPGLMPAMTMNFEVADPELFDTLARGQRIEFTVEFTGRSYRVADVVVRGEESDTSAAPLAEVADVRTPAPAFTLVDQDGREVSSHDLRGRTLLVDFVYTSCPGPCPILTGLHVALQRQLSPELRDRVWFVSISLDPLRDTPEALRAYAKARGADLSHWSFLTGDPEAVAAVVRGYGVGTLRAPDGEIEHVVATFLVDADGRIAERYLGLEHEPEVLLRDLARIASG